MSYGIPFDFNMPQFVNTRASQRIVVSVHAGGLGVFGGEGAQCSSLAAGALAPCLAAPQPELEVRMAAAAPGPGGVP